MKREKGIDAIRVLLTFLVVIHHVSIVYGGAGAWYWKEAQSLNFFLIVFNTINQSFFMGFFFLLAGYFSRISIKRKGANLFLTDRIIRLGIPLLFYFFLISPFTIALANPYADTPLLTRTLNMMVALEFEPGPLWFVFSLLIFSSIYSFTYRYSISFLRSPIKFPDQIYLAIVLILVGICAFVVRLIIPVGETFAWLQLGYFPMYILLFILGILVSKHQLLSSIKFSDIKTWIVCSFISIVLLLIVMVYPPGTGSFEGGANLNSLFYALWEPFTACGIILGLIYMFCFRMHRANDFLHSLSPLAYCIYIIHPPIVVFISIALHNWNQIWLIKLLVNSFISILICVGLSWLILRLPYSRRIL